MAGFGSDLLLWGLFTKNEMDVGLLRSLSSFVLPNLSSFLLIVIFNINKLINRYDSNADLDI